MAWILAVTSKTERTAQSVGDIVAVYDFEPTATEKERHQLMRKQGELMAARESVNGMQDMARSTERKGRAWE